MEFIEVAARGALAKETRMYACMYVCGRLAAPEHEPNGLSVHLGCCFASQVPALKSFTVEEDGILR